MREEEDRRTPDAPPIGEPAPEPVLHRLHVGGVELACFEWNPGLRGRGRPIVFAHATGFHARVWDRTVELLGPRHVFALDQRGHGRSQRTPITHWKVFGDDLAGVIAALGLRDVIGVGHSMGGHAMVEAAALAPDRFARLLLIDPVIAAPEEYVEGRPRAEAFADGVHPTARRRDRFASPDEMVERFRDRAPYRHFDPRTLRDYCTHGLRPRADGDGFELACPPATEASIYLTARTDGGVLDSARRVRAPVTVIRAKRPPPDRDLMDFSSSPTWPGLAGAFADGRDVPWPDRTHFVPLEDPAAIVPWVLDRDGRA